MLDAGRKHRVIGIRHVLRKLKDAGLVEQDSLYAREAVADIQDEFLSRARTWYMIGARRGAREVLEAFLGGKFTVRRSADGSREIHATADTVRWRKKLKVRVGSSSRMLKETTYRLSTESLGFE